MNNPQRQLGVEDNNPSAALKELNILIKILSSGLKPNSFS